MTPQPPSSTPHGKQSSEPPQGDPWHVFGYLVSGVLIYGVLGWLVDQWLGTSFMVGVGIVLGAGLGTYMTWARFGHPASAPQKDPSTTDRRPEQEQS
ncbi:MAG TPA: AtpZ/AtpI family protein [Nocardioidaceae bacterium]|nr:AtpZ/AtpI family protein [Nocardioidaceae bacterium]